MHPRIIKREAGLPLGFDTGTGAVVRFEDALADPGRLDRLKPLDAGERKALALARVEGCARWPTRTIMPDGMVDRARAAREIRGDTELAADLVQTEMEVLELVMEAIREEAAHG